MSSFLLAYIIALLFVGFFMFSKLAMEAKAKRLDAAQPTRSPYDFYKSLTSIKMRRLLVLNILIGCFTFALATLAFYLRTAFFHQCQLLFG